MTLITIKTPTNKYEGKVNFKKETQIFTLSASIKPTAFPIINFKTYRSHCKDGVLDYCITILDNASKPGIRFSLLRPTDETKKRGINIRGQDFKTGKFVPWTCFLKFG